MKVFYVTNIHPRSHNRGGSSDGYKQTLQQDFNSRYSQLYENLPIKNQELQTHVVYIHQLRQGCIPDVDNLSKPIVDAFIGIIYEDDNLIIRRTADILKLADFDFMSVDATNMPLQVYQAFENYYLGNERNILFFEVGNFDKSKIKIGEV